MCVLFDPRMVSFIKDSRLTSSDVKRKSGFVGTVHVTWHGVKYPELDLTIDVLPVVGHDDYLCLLQPRYSDGEVVGTIYPRGMELSSQKLDRGLFLSLSQDIQDGYCLAKMVRNLGDAFRTEDDKLLSASELIQSYLLKSTLFWIVDPKDKFEEVYPSLDKKAIYGEEPRSVLVSYTLRVCDDILQTYKDNIDVQGICWDDILEEIEYVKDLCTTEPEELSAQDIMMPHVIKATYTCDRNMSTHSAHPVGDADANASHDIGGRNLQKARSARIWATRIFRMLRYLLRNDQPVYVYYLQHMDVKVRDKALVMTLCDIFIDMLQPQ